MKLVATIAAVVAAMALVVTAVNVVTINKRQYNQSQDAKLAACVGSEQTLEKNIYCAELIGGGS